MATIESPEIVKGLLRKRGSEDGLTWKLIYQYKGQTGQTLFALYSDVRYCDIYQSPYVADPVLLMENGMLTDEGAEFLFGEDWAGQQEEFNAGAEDSGEDSYFW